jgi:acyl-coenzyme A synthetase/AMP-(fatty) acid ligase
VSAFGIRRERRGGRTADVGWITGHSYIVYGPLANGCTSVMFEGAPDYPDKDIWWEIVERYRVTVFCTAPTAIRACMKWGEDYAARHDRSSLRLLGTVGGPAAAWRVGRPDRRVGQPADFWQRAARLDQAVAEHAPHPVQRP